MRHTVCMHSVRARLAAALLVAGLAVGCGTQDQPADATSEAPASGSAGSATGGTDAASELLVFETMPDDYPSDLPVYPGSEPDGAMSMPGLGMFASFLSDASSEEIYEYFRTGLQDNGWSVEDAVDGGLDAAKDDRTVEVRVRPSDTGGQNAIGINLSDPS